MTGRLVKDIDQELEKMLKIKKEVDDIKQLRKNTSKLEVVSQLMYDHLKAKKLLKPDVFYYVASIEVKDYIEGYRG